MAIPTSRDTFKDYCLRKLGSPVITINISDDQLDDRVDEALAFYMDYNFDGTEKTFFKYQITQTDIDNKYLPVPDNIVGVINLFPVGSSLTGGDIFNIRYQIALNDLYTLTSVSMVPYYMAFSQIQFLEQLLVGQQPLRYNRVTNKLYIDMDWNNVSVGQYIVAEAYSIIDPTTYPKIWSERWLQNYATALIKRQWGENLGKFTVTLPNGMVFNGLQIKAEAFAELEKLEQQAYDSSLPASDFIY
jgi:hypothetical protein